MFADYTTMPRCVVIIASVLAAIISPAFSAEPIKLQPRAVLSEDPVATWAFDGGVPGWRAQNQCQLAGQDGLLVVESTGNDPYLYFPPLGFKSAGPMLLRLSMRSDVQRRGQVFWVTEKSPNWGEEKSQSFKMNNDGQWHEYTAAIEADSNLRHIRLDPGTKPGRIEVRSVSLCRGVMHPLEIEEVKVLRPVPSTYSFAITPKSRSISLSATSPSRHSQGKWVRPGSAMPANDPSKASPSPSKAEVCLRYRTPYSICRPDAPADWLTLFRRKPVSGNQPRWVGCKNRPRRPTARAYRPLVACGGKLPPMRLSRSEKTTVEFTSEAFQSSPDRDSRSGEYATD